MKRNLIAWLLVVAAAAVMLFTLVTPARAIRKEIGGAELGKLETAGAWIVDVRSPSEFAAGHIPGAVNVPLDQLQQAAASWSKSQPIVLYCATGARSANALAYLGGQGFRKIYDLQGGLSAWTGQLTSQSGTASVPTGPGTVKTNGRPVFIDFASST